ncbi:signal peptidase II [Corynebacterium mendelii]|uniref:Lipoprotein signal peptidase n=1 Tax=Corynebacterium mendelii TaxID=2765362 RepID=A0A939DY53_9CORY|nr:signal peptidase II [Corynebacterium mendelii]MBN9643123.1 signal peptidase II [Corynebacterium mendelii]
MCAIAVCAAVADQVSKHFILQSMAPGEVVPLIGDWFRFRLTFNSGAAFSMGENLTWLFTCIQIAFAVGILGFVSRRITDPLSAVGLACVAGGALGNLGDRLFRAPGFFVGHVVDFISVGNFAIFNIADSFISVGVFVFIVAVAADGYREAQSNRPSAKDRGQL